MKAALLVGLCAVAWRMRSWDEVPYIRGYLQGLGLLKCFYYYYY